MTRFLTLAAALVAALISHSAFAQFGFNTKASTGPYHQSVSFPYYGINAVAALSGGTPVTSGPTGYYAVTDGIVRPGCVVDSWGAPGAEFNSWNLFAKPGSPYTEEFGRRLYFGFHAGGNGGPLIQLNMVVFSIECGDEMDILEDESGNYVGVTYNAYRQGEWYGPNNVDENENDPSSDDVVYKNGEPGTMWVNEITIVGRGVSVSANNWPGATPQERLLAAETYLSGKPFEITGTFSIPLLGITSSSTVIMHAACSGDVYPAYTGDEMVNVSDLLLVITQWGSQNSPADANHDGAVNVSDLLEVIMHWGSCP